MTSPGLTIKKTRAAVLGRKRNQKHFLGEKDLIAEKTRYTTRKLAGRQKKPRSHHGRGTQNQPHRLKTVRKERSSRNARNRGGGTPEKKRKENQRKSEKPPLKSEDEGRTRLMINSIPTASTGD